jgi:Uma2 family endonuclease
VLETPPFLCVEIVSSKDRLSRIIPKLAEYRTFGVPHIWLIDPDRNQAFTYDGGLQLVHGDVITAGDISLPLSEVFQNL